MPPLRLCTWLFLGLAAAALAGCRGSADASGTGAPAGALVPGDRRVALAFGGRDRSYIAHVPPAAGSRRLLPLLFVFHGGGSNAAGQQRFSRLDGLADRAGFVVVYPNGTGRFERFLTWNAGTCCGSAVVERVDDVGFSLAVLDDVARRLPVDRERVYATGMSNGAMMAHRLGAEASERIAAIAPVAGGMVFQRFAPARPVPVLHIHSLDDPRALYHGGLGPAFPGTRNRVLHPDVDEMIQRWAERDGCGRSPRLAKTLRAANGHTASLLVWDSCAAGVEVGLWRLTGAGHVWPGSPARLPRLLGADTDARCQPGDLGFRLQVPAALSKA